MSIAEAFKGGESQEAQVANERRLVVVNASSAGIEKVRDLIANMRMAEKAQKIANNQMLNTSWKVDANQNSSQTGSNQSKESEQIPVEEPATASDISNAKSFQKSTTKTQELSASSAGHSLDQQHLANNVVPMFAEDVSLFGEQPKINNVAYIDQLSEQTSKPKVIQGQQSVQASSPHVRQVITDNKHSIANWKAQQTSKAG